MYKRKYLLLLVSFALLLAGGTGIAGTAQGQEPTYTPTPFPLMPRIMGPTPLSQADLQALLDRLAQLEARILALEQRLTLLEAKLAATPSGPAVLLTTPLAPPLIFTPPPPPAITPSPTTVILAPSPTQARPAEPGLIADFEIFGTWKRGDEPYGTFTQSSEQAHSGYYSSKLAYNFPTTGNDYVVFLNRIPVGGYPNQISIWVYGDGSGHYLNVWVRDSQGETWQATFGQIKHWGWGEMFARLDNLTTWPAGHISGPANGALDYPIDFQAIILDDAPDTYVGSGTIYIDDLRAEIAAALPPPTPTPTWPPTAPPPTAPPPPAGTPTIDFRADKTDILSGECTTLRWDVENVREVYLRWPGHEEGVVGHGSKEVCPTSNTTYTLHVIKPDGSSEDRQITIKVTGIIVVDMPPNISLTISPDAVGLNVPVNITINAIDDLGLEWIQWQAASPKVSVLNGLYDCGGATNCSYTWTVMSVEAGDVEIVARTRDTAMQQGVDTKVLTIVPIVLGP